MEAARKNEGELRGRAQDTAAEARAHLKRLDKELRALQVRCPGAPKAFPASCLTCVPAVQQSALAWKARDKAWDVL